MSDKRESGRGGRDSKAPAADRPEAIRNVVLVGHTGAGKTTLVEALLAATGVIGRAGRVEDGGTVTDSDEIEHRLCPSVSPGPPPPEFRRGQGHLPGPPGEPGLVRGP